ncbi:hypothetical protein [Neorickettsia findlayensis]|uniref:Uncharacterized protein n=1 Tax=Neorickettsia findlayensis TaxID=2686014 RepID=A0A6P1GA15_9RICK|nr:hypothetical protein [Neorickettsia findlayensis]QHD65329.1 hypothetical protein GP480_02635 [Neorickettsia findlayensis]
MHNPFEQGSPQPSDEEPGAVGGQQQDDPQPSDEEPGAVGGQQQDDPQPSDEEPGAVGGQQQDDPQSSDEEQGAAGPPDDPIRAARRFLLSGLTITTEVANILAFGGGPWFAFLVAAWAYLRHPLSRRAVCHLLQETGYVTQHQIAMVESTRQHSSRRESLLMDLVRIVMCTTLVVHLVLGLWTETGMGSPFANPRRDNSGDGPPQGPLQDPDVSGDERDREFD